VTAPELSLPRSHVGLPRPVAGARPLALPRRARPVPVRPRPAPVLEEPGDEPVTGGRRDRRRSIGAAVVVAVVAAAAAVTMTRGGADGPARGEAIVTLDGTATVQRAGGDRETVTDERVHLRAGDRIRLDRGAADLTLADEVTMAARAGDGAAAATVLTMGALPVLESGPLLVDAPEGTRVAVGSHASTVTLGRRSAARLTRSTAVSVSVYEGSAQVASAGRRGDVGARRTADLVGPGEIGRPRPLDYRAEDAWDRRYLGVALAVDGSLRALVSGARAGRVDPIAYARRVVATAPSDLAAAAVERLAGDRRPDLDRAIAVAVVAHAPEPFADAWERGMAFRDAGARWGLVVLELGADGDAAVDQLLAGLDDAPVLPPGVRLDARGGVIDPTGDGSGGRGGATGTSVGDATVDRGEVAGDGSGGAGVGGSDGTGGSGGSGGSGGTGGSGTGGGGGSGGTGGGETPPEGGRPTLEVPVSIVPPVVVPEVLGPLDPVTGPLVGGLNDTTGALGDTLTGTVDALDTTVAGLPLLGGLLGPVTGTVNDLASGLLTPAKPR